MKPQPECPEREKLSAVSEESNKIGDFLAWLERKGFAVCEYGSDDYLVPVCQTINQLLAEYYEIDLDKVETERRALLDWLQESRDV